MGTEDFPFSKPAGHVRSKMAATGGTLELDGHRLVFKPQAVARSMGQKEWSKSLSAIREIDTVGRNLADFMCGGLRRRLRITTTDGRQELFTVSKAEAAAEELQALVEADAAA